MDATKSTNTLQRKIAIDVALLPSHRIRSLAIGYNHQLSGVRDGTYPSFSDTNNNAEGYFPHISLCQGFLYEKDMDKVKAALRKMTQRYAERHGVVPLQITHPYTNKLPNGLKGVGLGIKKTENLQKLHTLVMRTMKNSVTYEGEISAFYKENNEPLDEVSLSFVTNFKKDSAFKKFSPHITLGIGDIIQHHSIDTVIEDACTLAFAQLGNYCTVRKIFERYVLLSS